MIDLFNPDWAQGARTTEAAWMEDFDLWQAERAFRRAWWVTLWRSLARTMSPRVRAKSLQLRQEPDGSLTAALSSLIAECGARIRRSQRAAWLKMFGAPEAVAERRLTLQAAGDGWHLDEGPASILVLEILRSWHVGRVRVIPALRDEQPAARECPEDEPCDQPAWRATA